MYMCTLRDFSGVRIFFVLFLFSEIKILGPFLRNSWAPFYSTAHRKWKGLPLLLSGREHKYNPIFSLKDQEYFYHFPHVLQSRFVQSTVIQGQEYSFPSTLAGFYNFKVGPEKCFEILAVGVLKRHRKLLCCDGTPTWLQHQLSHYYRSLWRSKAVPIWLFPPAF